ncbi:putative Zn-dependent peptidase [Enterococcus sp. PF1-24]|uniref:EF-P 5-aminopentanol modification-associated protein YfmF n=1 Tax=unclassified Enterococcus TaxID=2608891 RepID=UPI0024772CE0|nr:MULTISPECIES: pitrilysin family protein [unclassified Enterococcus]MDH6364825.1 putative Zn-dependent peptidase [Enterococcus sp. PFB1-1]MDH6401951.1 putative Zn-dependent peptidase [Enterococcus sp. PF1-24]
MSIQLAQGVNLHVIETQKYKTIRFFIRFTNRLDKATITKRALLTSLMETNSLHYPDQKKLSSQLAELYGANFGLGVGRKGNWHWVNANLHLVNSKYVNDPQLLPEAVAFLKEILFYPNLQAGSWEQQTFDLEKENLKSYLESLKEDKQTYASLALQELYFSEDENQKIPSVGRIEDLVDLTAADLAAYYQKMLAEDQVDIFVVGDVNTAEIAELMATLPFSNREILRPEVFYHQATTNIVKERQVQEPVMQGKLNLAYSTEVYYGEAQRFALMVFNGLFGGFPHSKLFMNVREKASLAYYASSSVDTFRGYLSVQTGIESKNRQRVLKLIDEQLESLRHGEISELELAQTKAMLRNQYLLSLDNAQSAIETAYLNAWLPKTVMSDEKWLAELEKVTVADVQKIAKNIHLQGIFFLDGMGGHA